MSAHGPRNGRPLSDEDVSLIVACKTERQRLAKLHQDLKRADGNVRRPKHQAERDRIKRELQQLTDASLAKKFETTKYQIFLIPGEV